MSLEFHMNRKEIVCWALCLCCAICLNFFVYTPGWAATYYVDAISGSNANAGSSGSPWKEVPGTSSAVTPTTGWTTIQPGDTIILTGGQTWTKTVTINSTYYANGTSGSPITITSSSTTNRAIFDYSGGGSRGFDVIRDYITLQYLEIRNINASNSSGIRIGQSGSDSSVGVKVLYSYIHEISDPLVLDCTSGTEQFAYGIELQNRSGTEIAYNIIKNINKKWISSSENYAGGDSVHHNVMYQEASYSAPDPFDHGIVISSIAGNNYVYNNILWNNHLYYGSNYAINMVQAGDNNKIYNNIIRGFNIGITVRTSSTVGNYNEINHNTIYLADMPGTMYSTCSYGETHYGIIIEDGTGHIIKNNIIYYPQLVSGTARMIWFSVAGSSTVENNVFYRDGSTERIRVGSTYYTIANFDSTFAWANNNTVVNPGFSGGSHLVANLPTGFDSNWHPNNTGLKLSASIPGQSLSAPYTVDVDGKTRTHFDVGAYEYSSSSIMLSLPTNLRILN